MKSFSNDLISCDILTCYLDDDDISGERWKLAYTDICDEHAPNEKFKTKRTIKFMDDP